jgi:hypothetical protein
VRQHRTLHVLDSQTGLAICSRVTHGVGTKEDAMRKRMTIAVGVAFLAFANLASSAAPAKLYAAIFGITINEKGELISIRLDKVIDPQSGSTKAVNVAVPERYIASARDLVVAKKYEPRIKGGKPAEFFTWFFFDPERPERADIAAESKK